MSDLTLHIEGMSCAHCLNAVNSALHAVPGVTVKRVQMGRADLTVPENVSGAELVRAVAEAGYRATAQESTGTP